MVVSPELLVAMMPTLPAAKAAVMAPFLSDALAEGQINTRERISDFVGQLAHESADLLYMEEIASGAAYEGRADLGNSEPGDGVRYKGRGPIQLTGRANYRAAGAALGLDLEGDPVQAAQPEVGFRTAVWYWVGHGLNDLADAGDYTAITQRINGGQNGADDRVRRRAIALAALDAAGVTDESFAAESGVSPLVVAVAVSLAGVIALTVWWLWR